MNATKAHRMIESLVTHLQARGFRVLNERWPVQLREGDDFNLYFAGANERRKWVRIMPDLAGDCIADHGDDTQSDGGIFYQAMEAFDWSLSEQP